MSRLAWKVAIIKRATANSIAYSQTMFKYHSTNTNNVRNGKSSTVMEETVALTDNNASERKSVINMSSKPRNIYEEKPRINVRKIDLGAFVVGLLLFLTFNLVYWLTFSLYSFN